MADRRRILTTRRGLIKTAGVAAGAAALVQLLPGCSHPSGSDTSEPVVVDDSQSTNILESYQQVDLQISETGSYDLSLGCAPREGSPTWVAAIEQGDSASHLFKATAVSLLSGNSSDVVTRCMSGTSNWVIYDAHCSDEVFAWVELNTLDRSWRLYGAPFADGALTAQAMELWQSDANYDPPQACCAGPRVIWQVMPSTSGSKTNDSSYCYLWRSGQGSAKSVVESRGRFAAAPCASASTVTLCPRVRNDEGTYYGITAYSLDNDMGSVIDQLVLPVSVRPMCAVRIGDEFAFSIEANYSSGGLLASMGTYIGHGTGPFVRLAREPFAGVAGNGRGLYVIKSVSSYFVVDTVARTYSILAAASHTVDYGEYPATVGLVQTFATFATLKNVDTGYPSSVTLRTFAL